VSPTLGFLAREVLSINPIITRVENALEEQFHQLSHEI
jgi:hypothetical protein